MRPAGARLRLLWQTRDGTFALVERFWGDGETSTGILRRDGLWLQINREFLDALAATVTGTEDGGREQPAHLCTLAEQLGMDVAALTAQYGGGVPS